MSEQKPQYEIVKAFSLQTDLHTQIITEVSAREVNGHRAYRVATLRHYTAPDGSRRKSPWLGVRELVLKPGLEKAAMDFIAAEKAKAKAPAPEGEAS